MKYAYVRDGIVQSVFDTDRPLSDFPDIAPFTVECGKEVECNWGFDGKTFAPVVEPQPETGADGLTDDERAKIKELLAKVKV